VSFSIIMPTYNECENLPLLMERIFVLPIPELNVLVIDDHSPDGNGTESPKSWQSNMRTAFGSYTGRESSASARHIFSVSRNA